MPAVRPLTITLASELCILTRPAGHSSLRDFAAKLDIGRCLLPALREPKTSHRNASEYVTYPFCPRHSSFVNAGSPYLISQFIQSGSGVHAMGVRLREISNHTGICTLVKESQTTQREIALRFERLLYTVTDAADRLTGSTCPRPPAYQAALWTREPIPSLPTGDISSYKLQSALVAVNCATMKHRRCSQESGITI